MPPPSFLDQQHREGSLTRTPIATGEGLIQKPAPMSPSDSAVAAKASSLERTRASDKSDRSSLPKSAVPSSSPVSSAETATATATSPDSTVSTSRVGRPAAEAATSQAVALLVAEPLGGRASDTQPVARSGTQASTTSKPSTGRTPPQVPSKPLHLQLRAAGSVPVQPTQAATGGAAGSPTSTAWGIAALSAHTIVRLSRDLMIILTSKGIVPQ